MKTTITHLIDQDHRSHYWYGGECAKIKYKGYAAVIEACGDVYAEYAPNREYKYHVKDKHNAGWFYHEMHNDIKSDKELYEAIENGDLLIDNNNWWECFIYDKDGNFHDLMWVLNADYLDDAIDEVKADLKKMIEHIRLQDCVCKWQSLTIGNIVPAFSDVLKQIWESLTKYHTIDIRWKYNRNGF